MYLKPEEHAEIKTYALRRRTYKYVACDRTGVTPTVN